MVAPCRGEQLGTHSLEAFTAQGAAIESLRVIRRWGTGCGVDRAVFPQGSVVWELNYRGDLTFLHQARAQEATRDLHVYDGWLYFVHGWTQAIGRVFNLNLSAEVVADLERLVAETVR